MIDKIIKPRRRERWSNLYSILSPQWLQPQRVVSETIKQAGATLRRLG